jgi:hypothetical protein
MLRKMFWTGLTRSLKDVSGHKFDTIEEFDQLRVALRRIEADIKQRLDEKSAQQVAKAVATEESPGEMKELKCIVQKLCAEVSALKNTNTGQSAQLSTCRRELQ